MELRENILRILREELGEYSRSLKNARKQGSGLRFPKTAIKYNPLRFRPYSRETVEDKDPKVGTGKKPKGSDRRLYTDENPTERVFNHNYEDLLDNISSKDTGISWVEPEELLNDKIKTLKKISKKSEIKLYRLVYSKSKTDINTKKIGNHFVEDLDYFHEQMIDYLYYNAKKENKKLQKDDLWVIEIKTPTNNIDYHKTILTFSLHPNEDEITIIDDKKVKIVNIFKY
jgi:hypothetical protein